MIAVLRKNNLKFETILIIWFLCISIVFLFTVINFYAKLIMFNFGLIGLWDLLKDMKHV